MQRIIFVQKTGKSKVQIHAPIKTNKECYSKLLVFAVFNNINLQMVFRKEKMQFKIKANHFLNNKY